MRLWTPIVAVVEWNGLRWFDERGARIRDVDLDVLRSVLLMVKREEATVSAGLEVFVDL